MKRSIKLLTIIAVAGGVSTTLPMYAQESGPQSDTVLFGPASNPFSVVGYLNASETNASEFFPAFLPAAPSLADGAVLLYEDASQSLVSDQIWVQSGQWYFASDPDLQNLTVPVLGTLVEDGTFQDVSGFFGLPGGSMQVMSDVPEPGMLSLALLGGGALIAFRGRGQPKRP
ncbi:MAG: hypothetical protein QOJ40_1207 [Verrucomicrobiota bacterium]